jgi:hypothetical protein
MINGVARKQPLPKSFFCGISAGQRIRRAYCLPLSFRPIAQPRRGFVGQPRIIVKPSPDFGPFGRSFWPTATSPEAVSDPEPPWDCPLPDSFFSPRKLPARPAGALRHCGNPDFSAECLGFVAGFPGELRQLSAEMAVARGLPVNWPAKVERVDDSLRCELEVFANQTG